MRPFSLPVLLLMACAGTAQAQTTEERIGAIESGLGPSVVLVGQGAGGQQLLAEMEQQQVSAVSVAVIRDGKIAWAKGYGRLRADGPPVTTETLFQAASLSKSITAMGALRLVEDGVLALDAPVESALKSWSLPANSFTPQQSVTLRGLLSHTAGVSVHGFGGYAAGRAVPTLRQVLDGAPPANSGAVVVEAVPGSRFSYSGGGFTIVQQMMIDATGTPFPALMQTLVLAPLGMRHSTFAQPLPPAQLAEAALPLDAAGKPVEGGPHVYPEMAAAGLWTTPSDLARWVIEVQRSLRKQSNLVLGAAMTRSMLTPVKGDYALGVDTSRTDGQPSFTHGGGNEGYRTIYFAYENGDGVVIMTNGNNGDVVQRKLLRSIANSYGWPDFKTVRRNAIVLAPEVLAAYAGAFEAQGLGHIDIRLRDGQLEVKTDQPFMPLLASGAGAFFTLDHPRRIDIRFDSPEQGTMLVDDQPYALHRSK